jgi:hypothetical protein
MRFAIAFPLRALLCALLLAPIGPHAETDKRDFSQAERLLFMTPQLKGLQAPMLLRYTFGKTGTFEQNFDDSVTVALSAKADGRCCDAKGVFLSGRARCRCPTCPRPRATP